VDIKKIVVVGAGPAGMMAAIRSGVLGQEVTLIEKNNHPGLKLLLSGKGRCNLTNACDLNSFLSHFAHNGQFLRDAFKKFFNSQMMHFFQERGLKLEVERQMRVFPCSNKSASILKILENELRKNKVRVLYGMPLDKVLAQEDKIKAVLSKGAKVIPADRVILATGGLSYPSTGSTGEGITIAGKLGHRIVPLLPGLIPLVTKQKYGRILKGLVLKNIRLNFSDGERRITSDVGELLFTDFGISGPLVLSLSARVVDWLKEGKSVYAEIDLKPGLSLGQLEARILREFKENPKKNLKNTLKSLLPLSMAGVFLEAAGINPFKKVSHVVKGERQRIVCLLKRMRLDIEGSRPIEEAMVSRGGVSLKDINPRTMESRLIRGLYFAGEMIDVDADTGGFNLQAAFSTGYLAGESAALS